MDSLVPNGHPYDGHATTVHAGEEDKILIIGAGSLYHWLLHHLEC